VETGMVAVTEPVTTIHLDTPAGLVRVYVEVADGVAERVTLRNVPSFLHGEGLTVDAGGSLGELTLDVAFGGNFYGILPVTALGPDLDPDLDPAQAPKLIERGLAVVRAIDEQLAPVHPGDPRIHGVEHVILTAPGRDGADARGATVIEPGWIDRSPCGTGSSARMAQLHAKGKLALHTPFVHESLIGSRFTGHLVEETTVGTRSAVVPTITGRAWITGTSTYLLDPDDPFPRGFLLGVT
jgi:proline racemase